MLINLKDRRDRGGVTETHNRQHDLREFNKLKNKTIKKI